MMALGSGADKGVQVCEVLKFQAHDGNIVTAVLRALILYECLIEYCTLLVQRQVCHFKQQGSKAVFAKAAVLFAANLVDDTIAHHVQAHAGFDIEGIFCKILIKVDVSVGDAFFVTLDFVHFTPVENKHGKTRPGVTESVCLRLNKNHAQFHAVVRIAALDMLVKVFLHDLVHAFEQTGHPARRNLGQRPAEGAGGDHGHKSPRHAVACAIAKHKQEAVAPLGTKINIAANNIAGGNVLFSGNLLASKR